mmetsp:Transcript_26824/g.85212  ORF Transcript_26824/g.85212 Transcript_26824/m.85212 type:complete len:222 (-) Transcript_26824:107-772(-)
MRACIWRRHVAVPALTRALPGRWQVACPDVGCQRLVGITVCDLNPEVVIAQPAGAVVSAGKGAARPAQGLPSRVGAEGLCHRCQQRGNRCEVRPNVCLHGQHKETCAEARGAVEEIRRVNGAQGEAESDVGCERGRLERAPRLVAQRKDHQAHDAAAHVPRGHAEADDSELAEQSQSQVLALQLKHRVLCRPVLRHAFPAKQVFAPLGELPKGRLWRATPT